MAALLQPIQEGQHGSCIRCQLDCFLLQNGVGGQLVSKAPHCGQLGPEAALSVCILAWSAWMRATMSRRYVIGKHHCAHRGRQSQDAIGQRSPQGQAGRGAAPCRKASTPPTMASIPTCLLGYLQPPPQANLLLNSRRVFKVPVCPTSPGMPGQPLGASSRRGTRLPG